MLAKINAEVKNSFEATSDTADGASSDAI